MGGQNETITEELIFKVTGIPIVGIKFYEDHKFSDACIEEFPKELSENEALVKQEGKTYF